MSVTVRVASSLAALALVAVACGGAATPAPTSPATSAAATATSGSTTAPVAGALTFNVDASSKATVRVREQLARVPAPSDAVLTVTGMTGSFTLDPDGTFASGSKISADMNTISSDESRRDDFIKRGTLEVSRFPRADFAPTRASGLTLPLPASGEFSFRLTGNMTIHGTTKEVTFDVKATRAGSRVTAVATNNPAWRFGDFGMEVPSALSVLSIVDEIRLEMSLVANQAG